MAQQRNAGQKRARASRAPRRILATLPDAVGAQTVVVIAGTQSKPVLALLLLKIGEGIKDADVIACHDRNEASAILQDHKPLDPKELPLETGRTLIAAALHERAPADDWPEAARRTGLDDLRARAIAGRDWLDVLDPGGELLTPVPPERAEDARAALRAAADWAERHPIVRTWEEDLACLIDAGADPNAHRRELYEYVYPAIERNRTLWQEVLLRAAVVLRHCHGDWFGMALSAEAFNEAANVQQIPIACVIAGYTARTFHENPDGRLADEGEADAGTAIETGPPAEPGELEALLARAGVEASATWLDGYMTACELAPEPTNPDVWANDLVIESELGRDLESAKRLVGIALQRFETLIQALEDTEAIAESVADVADADLAAWARGFTAATERLAGSWPSESLRPIDRVWLDALAALARDGTPIADRPGLANWLAERAEITAQPEA